MIKWSEIELVRAITSTFMHGFQNNLAQLFIEKFISGLKVKVILEGQMIKWSFIEPVRAITSTVMHGFQNNLAQSFETFVQVG